MRRDRLITRGIEWPNEYPKDRTGNADNFDKILDLYAYLLDRPE